MARKPKVELGPGRDGRWYFHKVAGNGEVTMDSQGYKEKRYAKVAIKREYPGLQIVEVNAIDE